MELFNYSDWIYSVIMGSFCTTSILVALLSMAAVLNGRDERKPQRKSFNVDTESRTIIFNMPNIEHNRKHEIALDDAVLEESLNLIKSLEFYANADDTGLVESKPDSTNIVHKDPEMDIAGHDDENKAEIILNSLDNTSSDGLEDASGADPVVVTLLGRVRGLTLEKAHVFYGIPYADPPVGDKRWAPPSPVSPWLYTYNATFPRPACMQICAGEFSRLCPPEVCNI